jgi:glycosyltransferase involved in cell wall biosynthesis
MLAVNRRRGVYTRNVDRYICLTRFALERFVRAGLPARLLVVRANGLLNPPDAGRGEGKFALYVGRLSKEKGVETLIRAWQGIDFPLRIVGEGPLRSSLEQLARSRQVNVSFEGFRTRNEVHAFMQDATLMVTPSEWYEGFPVVTLEGLAAGTPMVVSALGALDEIIDSPANGLKFSPGDPVSLRQAAISLIDNATARSAMRLNNRKLFEEQYSSQSAVRSLESIYDALRINPASGEHPTPRVGREC